MMTKKSNYQILAIPFLFIIVVQSVVIYQLYQKDVEYSTLSGVDVDALEDKDKVILLTSFKRSTSVNDLDKFLNKNGLEIISGPNIESHYRLLLKIHIRKNGDQLNEEEISDLIFDLLDNNIIDFMLRDN